MVALHREELAEVTLGIGFGVHAVASASIACAARMPRLTVPVQTPVIGLTSRERCSERVVSRGDRVRLAP